MDVGGEHCFNQSDVLHSTTHSKLILSLSLHARRTYAIPHRTYLLKVENRNSKRLKFGATSIVLKGKILFYTRKGQALSQPYVGAMNLKLWRVLMVAIPTLLQYV